MTAFDAYPAMVELATQATGLEARLMPFHEIEFEDRFDGIWANASLLHVPSAEIDGVLDRLIRALRAGGILYMSVKFGDGERAMSDGRFFCDYNEASLAALFGRHPQLTVLHMARSPAWPGQPDGKSWLSVISRKGPALVS